MLWPPYSPSVSSSFAATCPSYGFWLFVRRVCCAGGGGGGGAAAAASDSGAAFSLKKLVQLSSFFRVKLYRQLQDFTVLILVVCAGCIT